MVSLQAMGAAWDPEKPPVIPRGRYPLHQQWEGGGSQATEAGDGGDGGRTPGGGEDEEMELDDDLDAAEVTNLLKARFGDRLQGVTDVSMQEIAEELSSHKKRRKVSTKPDGEVAKDESKSG